MDYSAAFDGFLATDTWYKSHPNDEGRFYHALATVVRHPDFNGDDMGTYFREHLKMAEDDPLSGAVSKYVTNAWAVREFLEYTGEL